jgi:uncharacterized membrane protein YjdF
MMKYVEKLVTVAVAVVVNVSILIFLSFQPSVQAAWLLECLLAFVLVFAELFPKRFPLKKTLLFWTLLFWLFFTPQLCTIALCFALPHVDLGTFILPYLGFVFWVSFFGVLLLYSLEQG